MAQSPSRDSSGPVSRLGLHYARFCTRWPIPSKTLIHGGSWGSIEPRGANRRSLQQSHCFEKGSSLRVRLARPTCRRPCENNARAQCVPFRHGWSQALRQSAAQQQVALRLSSLQRVSLEALPNAVILSVARPLYESLHCGSHALDKMLQDLARKSLIMWGPNDNGPRQQFTQAFFDMTVKLVRPC